MPQGRLQRPASRDEWSRGLEKYPRAALELQLDTEDVAFGLPGVLHGVDDGLVPGERPRLARVNLRELAVGGDLRFPVREVDAHPVRVPVARLDLARRKVDVEDAHELVLEGHAVRVPGHAHGIERV